MLPLGMAHRHVMYVYGCRSSSSALVAPWTSCALAAGETLTCPGSGDVPGVPQVTPMSRSRYGHHVTSRCRVNVVVARSLL